jgi:hypothetical protein
MAVLLAASIAALLAQAKPGDTVVLPPGDYGPETITNLSFSPPVTLDAQALRSTNITFQDVTGLRVRGGAWANAVGETWAGHTWAIAVKCVRCHDVSFDGAAFIGPPADAPGRDFAGYGLSFEDSDHVAATNSKFTGFRMGLGFTMTSDFTAKGDDFGFMTSDGIDVAQAWRGVIEDNRFHDTHIIEKEHPDGVQMWSYPNAPPTSDIAIRHNRVSGATQGLGGFDGVGRQPAGYRLANGRVLTQPEDIPSGGFDRIVIEDNEVEVGYPDGISLINGRDSVIRNNRVRTSRDSRYRASFLIRPDDGGTKHCGNVAEPGAGKDGWDDGRCPKR